MDGRIKLVIADKAVMITIGAPIIPASTAACPITRVPTILTAVPTALGILIPDSRINWKITSLIRVSIRTGKGIPSLAAAKVTSRTVGIISWWKVVREIYKAGSVRVINNARTLSILTKLVRYGLE